MTEGSRRGALFRRARLQNARVYQQLRTAHLERAHTQTPATMLYVVRNYDFSDALTEGLDLIQAGAVAAPTVMLASRLRAVEVNEPLMRQRLERTWATIVAARIAARIHRLPVRIVTHGIENLDPFSVAAPTSLKGRARLRLDRWLSRRIARQIDRISFGTEASRELYLQQRGGELRHSAQQLFEELPAPCNCAELHRNPLGVAFLGAFDERKGVRQLLSAWPTVASEIVDATLTLMGKGALTEEVVAAAADLHGTQVVLDPPREETHVRLREAQVLVLLSQKRVRWREQVGLPIVEGLAHGCTIVTTDQTGLADWLSSHGHFVVASDASDATVAEAIASALRAARPASEVLADLPDIDGRTAADAWLFAD